TSEDSDRSAPAFAGLTRLFLPRSLHGLSRNVCQHAQRDTQRALFGGARLPAGVANTTTAILPGILCHGLTRQRRAGSKASLLGLFALGRAPCACSIARRHCGTRIPGGTGGADGAAHRQRQASDRLPPRYPLAGEKTRSVPSL